MHIKTITEEWVTHRGWGEGQLFPLSEHCSPLSTATFLVPPKYFTALAPYISHSPLGTSSERAMVLRSETGYKEFSGNKVQLFLNFFFLCASKERKGERHNSLAMNHLGSSATPTICTFRKCFPLKCSPCICSIIGRRMNSGKQRCADEIKFIYSLIPNSLPHSEIP